MVGFATSLWQRQALARRWLRRLITVVHAKLSGGRPRLLFVAHRKEILVQARQIYREVLRDHSFGEILAGGSELQGYDHIFATIDSVCARDLIARCGPQLLAHGRCR